MVGHVANEHFSQHSGRQMASSSQQGVLIVSSRKAAQNCRRLQNLCQGVGTRRCEEAWYLQRAGHFMRDTTEQHSPKQNETSNDWSTTEGLF